MDDRRLVTVGGAMAVVRPRAARPPRGRALALAVLVIVAYVAAIVFANDASLRSGYPFLDTKPPRGPDVVYMPSYFPAGTRPVGLSVGTTQYGVELEMVSRLASGDDLRVWESSRYDASPKDAVGAYADGDSFTGSLATWRGAITADGQVHLLYARIGNTLVVIAGPLPHEELLRIADSLRRTNPSSLIL